MKSQLFKTAWQFAKMTGANFAVCLRKAWANYKLKTRMQNEIVRFYFQKVDGSIREAWGTLRSDLLPETSENDRRKNESVQVYFDTEVNAFRCFKKFNLVN